MKVKKGGGQSTGLEQFDVLDVFFVKFEHCRQDGHVGHEEHCAGGRVQEEVQPEQMSTNTLRTVLSALTKGLNGKCSKT